MNTIDIATAAGVAPIMQADFSVELGRDDAAMEMPWSSPEDPQVRYRDVKRHPQLLQEISEAAESRELANFLRSVNSPGSLMESCKCDCWQINEVCEEEKIFGEPWKFSSYVDLIFFDNSARFSLQAQEEFCRSICKLLKLAPEMPCAAEFAIRRCYYHERGAEDSRSGFGITFYLSGFGDDEREAQMRWNIGIKLTENALLQLSASKRRAPHN